MIKFRLQKLSQEPQRSIFYLAGLFLIRAWIQITLFRQGFISVAADEFARGIRAAQWSENPTLNILADVQDIWLPFEKYLNGLILVIWPDVIIAPRVTVFIASCILLVTIYFFAYYLFNHFSIAVLSTLFVTFQPWYVWLSGTPMLEMYYFACFFGGFLFLIVWLKEGRKGFWLLAGILFLFASGFHVQSWTFINLVNLLTLPFLFKFIQNKEYSKISKLFAYYLISNGLIIFIALVEFIDTGEIFTFLTNHTSYSKWFYDGYEVSVIEKLKYYPSLILQNANVIIFVYLLMALAFLRKDPERNWKLFPLFLTALALLLNSFMNIFSGPPSAAPGRYSLFHIIIFSLYIAYSTYNIFLLGKRNSNKLIKYSLVAFSTLLFLYGIFWGAFRIPNFPQGMSVDAVDAGSNLHELLNDKPGNYMVELHYWDYLAVDLTSGHFDKIIYDREQDYRDRDTPSIFSQGKNEICKGLTSQNLNYVLLREEELKKVAQQFDMLKRHQNFGAWSIFEVNPDASCP